MQKKASQLRCFKQYKIINFFNDNLLILQLCESSNQAHYRPLISFFIQIKDAIIQAVILSIIMALSDRTKLISVR